MKIIRCFLVLFLLQWAANGSAADPAGEVRDTEAEIAEKIIKIPTREAFVDDQTGVQFPAQIGELSIWRVDDYRKISPEHGRGYFYGFPGVKVTIYVYTGGKTSIEPGVSDSGTKNALYSAIRDVYEQGELGYYQGIEAIEPQETEVDTLTGKQEFLWTKFIYTEKDANSSEELKSWLFITAYKDHFFKVRYTSSAELFEDEMPGNYLLNSFITDLGQLFE